MRRLIIIASLLVCGIAAAQPAETADAAFKRGKAALKAKKIREACEAFEASVKLEAKTEVELALADCYEQDGKLASSAKLYKKLAESDTNAARKKKSADKATKLEAKAPRMRLLLSARPEGLVVKVDGEEVTVTADPKLDVRVDIGTHEVIATAPGFEGKASAAVDGSRPIVDVIVRLEATAVTPPPEPEKPTPTPTPPVEQPTPPPAEAQPPPEQPMPPVETSSGSSRKRNGVILVAGGSVLVVTSVVLFALASEKFDTDRELCPNRECADQQDLDRANALRDNGTVMRNVGIGLAVGGVAAIVFGGYMAATAKSESSLGASRQVSVHPTTGGAGLSFSGRF